MKTIVRFLVMYWTAGAMLVLGLDHGTATPKQMIMITGVMCGIVNIIWGWIDGH